MNKLKLEWIIKFHNVEIGVLNESVDKNSFSKEYLDCTGKCIDCNNYVDRNLMNPNSSNNDFCLDSKTIKNYHKFKMPPPTKPNKFSGSVTLY